MLHYPEVQARAREEINVVTGGSRLPDFDDRPSLPYIDALISELLRWAPPVPLGESAISLRCAIFFFTNKYTKPCHIDQLKQMFTRVTTFRLERQYRINSLPSMFDNSCYFIRHYFCAQRSRDLSPRELVLRTVQI